MPDDRRSMMLSQADASGAVGGVVGGPVGDAVGDLLGRARHFWRVLLVAFLIPAAIGLAAALSSKPVYVAQARMLVLYASDYVFHPGNHDTGNDITLDRNQVMQAELQILQSPALTNQALAAIGPRVVYPALPEDEANPLSSAAERLSRDLSVAAIPQSNIIELDMRSQSRETAIATLQTLIARYLPYRAAIFEKSQSGQATQQQAPFAERLRQAEEAMSRFGIAHGISNIDEQTTLLLRQMADNTTASRQVAEQAAEAAAKLDAVRAQLPGVAPTMQIYAETERSQQVGGLTEQLVKLTGRRQELASQYTAGSAVLQDLDRQIGALRAQVAASRPRDGAISRVGRNPAYDELKSQESALDIQVQGLQARKLALAGQAERIKARSDELVGLSQQYRDLQRTRDVLDQSYRAISRSNEESQLSNALQRAAAANIRVIQPPDAPLRGRSLRLVFAAGGVCIGLLAAAAALALLTLVAPNAHRRHKPLIA